MKLTKKYTTIGVSLTTLSEVIQMRAIKRLSLILAAAAFLVACANHPDNYQGSTPKPEDLPPPTNLLDE